MNVSFILNKRKNGGVEPYLLHYKFEKLSIEILLSGMMCLFYVFCISEFSNLN